MSIGGKHTNRLVNEMSPYLLQHAHNPVNWYPWGNEAFAKSKSQDKPIFLSIGYSTCHWCHVMERESFQDEEVSSILNEHFISIKVDREERPDIDHIYMEICQMLTGSGGWPLTIIATPDRKPFFAGTYFPKTGKFGLPGLLNILEVTGEGWEKDRETILEKADQIYEAILEENREDHGQETSQKPPSVHEELLEKAFNGFSAAFDDDWGGFGTAPKFLSPHNLMFLLRHWKRTGQRKALDMVEKTFDRAYAGGVYDHIGYGFFRYSTDHKWQIPHFEKMLYDNAMSLRLASELYQATKKDVYKGIALEVADFIGRDLMSTQGGFFSAIDADSQGEEGKFYVWDTHEIISILGKTDGESFCKHYGINGSSQFEGKSVPHLSTVLTREDKVERLRLAVLSERNKRVPPMVDDKILTAWNSLAASALAEAYRSTGDERCLNMAEACVSFIQSNLYRDGVLYARYREGHVAHKGGLDDYAFLAWALLDLYQATHKTDYLRFAIDLVKKTVAQFWDERNGGFYLTEDGREHLIIRPKQLYDGAIPAGNSVGLMNMLRVFHLGGPDNYQDMALSALEQMSGLLGRNPLSLGYLLCAVNYAAGGAKDIQILGSKTSSTVGTMLNYVKSVYLPDTQTVFSSDMAEIKGEAAPDLPTMPLVTVCQGFTCKEPVKDVTGLQKALMSPR